MNVVEDDHRDDSPYRSRTKVDELMEVQERTERKFWFNKGVLEFFKISFMIAGGIGGYWRREYVIAGLIGAAICQALEYWLNYKDYDDHKYITKLMNTA